MFRGFQHLVSGGATVGSMGSHDPLEAMEVSLELHRRPLGAASCDHLELLVRPHHLFDKMCERRSRAALGRKKKKRAASFSCSQV